MVFIFSPAENFAPNCVLLLAWLKSSGSPLRALVDKLQLGTLRAAFDIQKPDMQKLLTDIGPTSRVGVQRLLLAIAVNCGTF